VQTANAKKISESATTTSSDIDSTKEMADLLQEIASKIQPDELSFIINQRRADYMHEVMMSATDATERERFRLQWATESSGRICHDRAMDEEPRRTHERR
jgi:hypothetical protein